MLSEIQETRFKCGKAMDEDRNGKESLLWKHQNKKKKELNTNGERKKMPKNGSSGNESQWKS